MQTVSIEQFKKDMKALGYKTRKISYSTHNFMSVFNDSGKINAGNVFSQEFFDENKAFFDYKKEKKIEKSDGCSTLF